MGHFVEVCRREDWKINADKSKVMVLGEEEGLECEIHVAEAQLKQVSELKYLECILDESDKDAAKCCRKMVSGRKFAGVIRSLVNVKG